MLIGREERERAFMSYKLHYKLLLLLLLMTYGHLKDDLAQDTARYNVAFWKTFDILPSTILIVEIKLTS